MKKIWTTFITFFIFCSAVFSVELKFEDKGFNIYITNVSPKGSPICKDSIFFINQTSTPMTILASRKENASDIYKRFEYCAIPEEETYETTRDVVDGFGKGYYLKLTCLTGKIKIEKIEGKSDNIYLYITDIDVYDRDILKENKKVMDKFLNDGSFICVTNANGFANYVFKNSISNITVSPGEYIIYTQHVKDTYTSGEHGSWYYESYKLYFDYDDNGKLSNIIMDEKSNLHCVADIKI